MYKFLNLINWIYSSLWYMYMKIIIKVCEFRIRTLSDSQKLVTITQTFWTFWKIITWVPWTKISTSSGRAGTIPIKFINSHTWPRIPGSWRSELSKIHTQTNRCIMKQFEFERLKFEEMGNGWNIMKVRGSSNNFIIGRWRHEKPLYITHINFRLTWNSSSWEILSLISWLI
jgi:hypothetical protein